MKTLIVLVVGLLSVGCGKTEPNVVIGDPDGWPDIDQNTTKAEPVKELTEEEKQVVGEYELIHTGPTTIKQVYLENGVREWYINSTKQGSFKWSIVDGEIHVDNEDKDGAAILRINKDRSITEIAYIIDGERTDFPKREQSTFKNIK